MKAAEVNRACQMKTTKGMKALVLILISMLPLVSGCAETINSALKDLADHECNTDVLPMVGSNRQVVLFIKNHIYVGGEGPSYDPNERTINKAGDYMDNKVRVDYVSNQAQQVLDDAKKIFADNGVNIILYSPGAGYDIIVDPEMIDVTYDSASFGMGYTSQVVYGSRKKNPGIVHVHWAFSSPSQTPYSAVGKDFSIVVGYKTVSGMTFAHELVHALGA